MTDPGGAAPARARNYRRYLSLAVLALALALSYGIWYAYSVILVALLKDFGWSRSVLGGAFSLFAVVHGASNPVLGTLCDRVRPPLLMAFASIALGLALYANSFINTPLQLYLGFGVLTAMAVAGCGWTPAVVQVQRRFQDRLGLALGIVSSGVGAGMLFVVPLCQVLIEAYGWRMAFRVLGATCVAVILPAALFLLHESAPRTRLAPAGAATATPDAASVTPSITLKQALRSAPFWLVVAAFFFGSLSSQTLHVHHVAYLVDHGIAAMIAASVVGVVGVSSIVGKTGGGWLSDRIERELVYIVGIVILVASIVALGTLGAAPSSAGAYLYAVMLGIGYSATAALTPAMMGDRFKGRHFGAIIGVGLCGSAAGSALGPWLAGWLHDVTGSYALPFSIAAVSGVLAGIAGWCARVLRRRARRPSAGADESRRQSNA